MSKSKGKKSGKSSSNGSTSKEQQSAVAKESIDTSADVKLPVLSIKDTSEEHVKDEDSEEANKKSTEFDTIKEEKKTKKISLVGNSSSEINESSQARESAEASQEVTNVGGTKDLGDDSNFKAQKSEQGSVNGSKDDSSEVETLRQQLEQAESERDEIQEEYDSLLEKVGTIKQKLGERFQHLQAESEAAKLETEQTKSELVNAQKELVVVREKLQKDLESNKTTALKAKETLEKDCLKYKTELDVVKAELAKSHTEAEAIRKQLISQKIMFEQDILNEKLSKESIEIENGQLHQKLDETEAIALQSSQTCDLQETKLAELMAEVRQLKTENTERLNVAKNDLLKSENERDSLKKQLEQLENQFVNLSSQSQNSIDLVAKHRQEAQENQILIGKLRHEAVILNDHLTQALRVIRKESEGSTVDKELVSNLFEQYATCPRQDTKKFEILQVIANFLDWDEPRRQSVGLMKYEDDSELPPTQMVGFVGKLAEFLESKRR